MTATPAARRDLCLGIDLGTSSVKAVMVDVGGRVIAETSAAYQVRHPHPSWAETSAHEWWAATGVAVREVVVHAGAQPAGIGLSGQMHGVVLTTAGGAPVRDAVLWADARATDELGIYERMSADTRRRLANPLSPGMAGPILAWIARNEPAALRATAHALQPKDWIRLQLTGRTNSEPSDASATLLYDLEHDTWDVDVAADLGVAEAVLPELLASSATLAGTLTEQAARHLGLTPGIPVAAGAADTAAAALGSGLVVAGEAQVTIGTGIQVVTPTDQAPAGARPVTHLYRAATDTGHYRMAAALNGGLALSWVCEALNAGWAELYAAAETAPDAGAPFFLPHLIGERTPYLDPTMRGGWTNLARRHTRTDLLRAALEGVAFAAAGAVDALDPDPTGSGVPAGRNLRLAGGGTTSTPWRQMLADVLHAELRVVSVAGASGRGAALLGARAAGLLDEPTLVGLADPTVTAVVSPNDIRAARYRERRNLFQDTVARLRAVRPSPTARAPH